MVWKANIDIQVIAESSLALAHYVSGYVTKAEQSTTQDLWQEVSSSKNIYTAYGALGFEVCVHENVGSMRLVIYWLEIICVRKVIIYGGSVLIGLIRGNEG